MLFPLLKMQFLEMTQLAQGGVTRTLSQVPLHQFAVSLRARLHRKLAKKIQALILDLISRVGQMGGVK